MSLGKGLIIKAIGKIRDPEVEREYLIKLKDIIVQEENKSKVSKRIL